MSKITTLFANDINRRIEEVIKVDQTTEDIVASEIDEYVATSPIKRHFIEVLERYQETPQKPHEGIAIWVSGFFGSGKSSFAKVLGLTIENRTVLGRSASDRFTSKVGDPRLSVVLKAINEKIPTHTVIFDVSTDRGIRSGNQMLTQIMYRLFLASLGYADDLDISELEIELEQRDELARFMQAYKKETGKEWDEYKKRPMFALNEASRTLHRLYPDTFPAADTWAKTAVGRTDITAGRLADRIVDLMKRRKPGRSLMFVIDEVGQFVARDVSKMLDLQAIVQQLGVKGRGKHWIVITSQEKLNELVSGLEGSKIELPRLMDRFPLQVHLEPSDIGCEPPRSQEDGRRRIRSRQAVRREPRADDAAHSHERGHHTARARSPIIRGPLSSPAIPDRPHHPGRVWPTHAGRRKQARRRRKPDHHQAGAAASHPSADPAGRTERGRTSAPRSGL